MYGSELGPEEREFARFCDQACLRVLLKLGLGTAEGGFGRLTVFMLDNGDTGGPEPSPAFISNILRFPLVSFARALGVLVQTVSLPSERRVRRSTSGSIVSSLVF